MKMGERIRAERLRNKLTQEEVARALNTTKQAIYKYEQGIVENIPPEKMERMAALFGVTPAYLACWDAATEQAAREDSEDSEEPRESVRVPVYGSVAAGYPIMAVTDIEDWEEIDRSLAATGEFAALRIRGDSMEPKISNGDVVIVRLQPTAETGDIAIVIINGDEATCKKIKRTPQGIMLISTNPAYEPMFYSNREIRELPVRVWGKVVELRAKFE